MSNEIAAMVLARPGEEAVVFAASHIYNLETGGPSAISGVQVRPVASQTGAYDPADLRAAIMPEGVQRPSTAFICLENTFPRKPPGIARQATDNIQVLCGLLMIACVLAIILYYAFFRVEGKETCFVFVAETVALVAFGVSWFTEGLDLEQVIS
jgi:hypothetical protein